MHATRPRVHRGILGYSLLFKTAVVDLLGTHAVYVKQNVVHTSPRIPSKNERRKEDKDSLPAFQTPLYDVFQTPWEITCLSDFKVSSLITQTPVPT